tara:strand:+ start:66 stop:572 length:507 start_codon:yes stop_codon:yes gene_type:complete
MNLEDKVNKLSKSDFISIFGNVFEKTEWIAEKTYGLKPFSDFQEIYSGMIDTFENSKKDDILKILNSHPELAIEKIMTQDSKKEQSNAQLNNCTKEELAEFVKLNNDYKKKFNFPFIFAVKGKNKKEILNNFRDRITNEINVEFEEAKKQVKKIASFRLNQIKIDNQL